MREKIRNNKGFTITELVIVIALIAILAAIAAPNFSNMMANMRLGGAARDVHAVLQQARLRAAKEQQWVVVAFNAGANSYEGFVDRNTANVNDGDTVFAAGSLPKGIEISKAEFSAATKPYVAFNKSGYPMDVGNIVYNGFIEIKNSDNSIRQVSLNAAGNVKIVIP